MPPSQDHTISRRYVHSVSATLSRPYNQPALRTLCQCHPLKTTQSAGVTYTLSVPPSQDHTISRRYVHSVSATLSRPYNQPALRTLCQCRPLKTIQSADVTYTLSVPPSQDHTISRRYVHSVSAALLRPYNQPTLRTLCQCHLSRPYNQPALCTLCQCHPLKTIQSAGVTYTLSVPPSQDHTISRRYVHSVSATLSRPHNQPALRTLCQCHPLKTIQSAGVTYTLSVPPSQDHTISRRYVHSVSAALLRPYNQPTLRTLCQCHLSRPYNQPALCTLCQCHPLKTIQSAGVMYTLSVPPSQDNTISRRYVRSHHFDFQLL